MRTCKICRYKYGKHRVSCPTCGTFEPIAGGPLFTYRDEKAISVGVARGVKFQSPTVHPTRIPKAV
jgi:hypothetical protein